MPLKKHIPNAITSMNLLCGSLGVVASLLGHIDWAFLLMISGAVFDFFDGFAARLLGVSSPMGRELDSLADCISFGLLPAIMMSLTLAGNYGQDDWMCWTPMIIAVFSGLRLAKFNIDTRQTTSFLGLPTPACAMICGSLAYFVFVTALADAHQVGTDAATQQLVSAGVIANVLGSKAVIIPTALIFSALLISEVPMFSLKLHKGDKLGAARLSFLCIAVLSLAAVAIFKLNWSLAVFVTFTAYIIINLIYAFTDKSTERK